MRRGVRLAAGLVTAVGFAAACIDLSTDPDEIVAIEFRPLPWPSVVVGDTMRDGQGQPAPLQARLFDASDDEVAGVPVAFLAREPLVTITSEGFVVGVDTGTVELLASTTGLQSSVRQVTVVPPPDTAFAQGVIDTLRWVVPDAPSANTSSALRAAIRSRTPTDTLIVRSWIVTYRLVFRGQVVPPGDTSLVFLVNDQGRPATIDTTDGTGASSLRVRVRAGPGLGALDSAVVTADAQYRGVPLAGSPVRFVVPIVPSTGAGQVRSASQSPMPD